MSTKTFIFPELLEYITGLSHVENDTGDFSQKGCIVTVISLYKNSPLMYFRILTGKSVHPQINTVHVRAKNHVPERFSISDISTQITRINKIFSYQPTVWIRQDYLGNTER